ncbi:MAG TPA: 5-methyltetrahydropteroyltriglutamate--homocysteine S-methyltransferase, partial [Gammaproteobacteria bacterium]|nr:5-methyltetrahydropteroyltriglutamate--homocysteine S-methyltransferase [Gammaproteobacteria bacterium]
MTESIDKPPFRAEHVGSLLRPRSLLELRSKVADGAASASSLRAHEDSCIRELVQLQEELGLRSITDGEFRRNTF